LPGVPDFSSLALVVFVAETSVVTLSTLRTIFIARGWKLLAPILGFFEVSIWLFAIGQVMQNLTRPDCYLAFAGGFSLGNFLGVLLEQKLALGEVLVQITTGNRAGPLVESLKAGGFGVTALDGQGTTGPVQVVFTVIRRRELHQVVRIIKSFDPHVCYSVKDLQAAAGIFRTRGRTAVPAPLTLLLRVAQLRKPVANAEAAASLAGSSSR
jgi:uncharacterized protein YebE (UPF0316 family)